MTDRQIPVPRPSAVLGIALALTATAFLATAFFAVLTLAQIQFGSF